MVASETIVGNTTKFVLKEVEPDMTPRGLAENIFAVLYPKTFRPYAPDEVETGFWAEFRLRLLGEAEGETRSPGRGGGMGYTPWGLSHFRRFTLVEGHAVALIGMVIGALAGGWLGRRTRRVIIA